MNLTRKQVLIPDWLEKHILAFAKKHKISYSCTIRYLAIEGLTKKDLKKNLKKDLDDYWFESRKTLEKKR